MYRNQKPPNKTAEFRFYAELNDFLPQTKRNVPFDYSFSDNPGIKDCIEALGVPHPEVDLIWVNDQSVTFTYKLKDGDAVAVYPLRPKHLPHTNFILDIHLGKLAKYLRMLGFDVLYENNYRDIEIINIAQKQHRIILTRDVGLLKDGRVIQGYWVRHITVIAQVKEIITRFDLADKIAPFTRCLACNGKLAKVAKAKIMHLLPADTKRYYQEFYQCSKCQKIYWQGSHYKDMINNINKYMRT
jgi:uncharacterized protein with PIN domain